MQIKTIQVELRGVANAFSPHWLRYRSHYLAVEICQRWTLLSATSSFQIRKNFENRQKHQRRRSAWVGQEDFGKLEVNNIRNHNGNSQRLSVKRDQFETRSIRNKRDRMFRPSCFRRRTRPLLSFAILRLLRKHSNKQTFHCSGGESWNTCRSLLVRPLIVVSAREVL